MRYEMALQSPVGPLLLQEEDSALVGMYFCGDRDLSGIPTEGTPLLEEAKVQLEEYFARKRKAFDLPLHMKGTQFQRRVWEALRQIPYGEACSYRQIAEWIGSPKAVRAIGMANNRNPISIIVPCHRVIGADGNLVGYGGGLDIKRALLELEGFFPLS